jgi:hypothetical protein
LAIDKFHPKMLTIIKYGLRIQDFSQSTARRFPVYRVSQLPEYENITIRQEGSKAIKSVCR